MSEEEIEPVEDAAEEQLDTNAAVEEQEASNEVTEEQLDEIEAALAAAGFTAALTPYEEDAL